MDLIQEWKKATAAFLSPLSLVGLIIALALNVAASQATTGSGWQVLFLVFAALSASVFGGVVVWRYSDCPSPTMLKASSAAAMIGIVRKNMGNKRKEANVVDDVLRLAQKELKKKH